MKAIAISNLNECFFACCFFLSIFGFSKLLKESQKFNFACHMNITHLSQYWVFSVFFGNFASNQGIYIQIRGCKFASNQVETLNNYQRWIYYHLLYILKNYFCIYSGLTYIYIYLLWYVLVARFILIHNVTFLGKICESWSSYSRYSMLSEHYFKYQSTFLNALELNSQPQ